MKKKEEELEDIWNRKKPFFDRHPKAGLIISIISLAIVLLKEFLS